MTIGFDLLRRNGVAASPRSGAVSSPHAVSALPATIFSDFTCPFCYVTEAALWPQAERGAVSLSYRALILYPPPTEAPSPHSEAGWREALEPLAGELDLALSAPIFRPRTQKAHEAARFAAARGFELPLRRALFEAYWQREADIGRIDVITDIAASVGVDREELKIALDIDLHHDDVIRDGEVAAKLRVPGAPTLYLGTGPDARILLGAHSASALDEALAVR